MLYRISSIAAIFALFVPVSQCQQVSPGNPPQTGESDRILGIIPNYRTSPSLQNYKPLTSREKFKIASEDASDRGTVGLAALFGGEGQFANANRSFGQGGAGFGRYFGAAYGDFVIGDCMTEAVFSIILRQDPRYFRQGNGKGWSRLAYAIGQIFWTHSDSGGTQFNYSEVIGNSDVLKEFWPDLERKCRIHRRFAAPN